MLKEDHNPSRQRGPQDGSDTWTPPNEFRAVSLKAIAELLVQLGGHPTRRSVLDPLVDTDTTLDSSTVSEVVSTSTVSTGANLSDEQEERAAIREDDGGLNREEADRRVLAETLDRDESSR
jgi:hypothetical protein